MADKTNKTGSSKIEGIVRHRASMEIPPQKPSKPNTPAVNTVKPKK